MFFPATRRRGVIVELFFCGLAQSGVAVIIRGAASSVVHVGSLPPVALAGMGRQGFMTVSLSATTMQVQSIDYQGNWMYQATVPRPT